MAFCVRCNRPNVFADGQACASCITRIDQLRARAMLLPRQQRQALLYLIARPGRYVNGMVIAEALGSTERGIGNVMSRLLEAKLVTCRQADQPLDGPHRSAWDWSV